MQSARTLEFDRIVEAVTELALTPLGSASLSELEPSSDPKVVVAAQAATSETVGFLERHPLFPQGTNIEFAHVESPESVRILIWERGVGPSLSSGTGSCAALVAAASFGGASRSADVVAPGGAQRVEWLEDSVYLTGWAEVLCSGEWRRQIPRTR